VSQDLANTDAEMLLRYYGRGSIEEAATIVTDKNTSFVAENLLYRKVSDPIGAAVGAYVLLRLGALDRLADLTKNLCDWFTWLPDGLVIRAEHLARLGSHAEALALLLQLPDRGLPYFSDGLFSALNRLRFYVEVGRKQTPAALPGLDKAPALLQQLQRFASYARFQKPILSFTGTDPGSPDDQSLPADLSGFAAVDLSSFNLT
jgi:hypothetical protein